MICANKVCCYKLCNEARAQGSGPHRDGCSWWENGVYRNFCGCKTQEAYQKLWFSIQLDTGSVFCDPKGSGKGSGGGKTRGKRRRDLLQSGGIPAGTYVTLNYEYQINDSTLDMNVIRFSVDGDPNFSANNVADLMSQLMASTD